MIGPDWSGHRVHSGDFAGDEFNYTTANDPYRGGRFDSHQGDYGYLYVASSLGAAVDETLIRDEPFDSVGARVILRSTVRARIWSELLIRSELRLVDLSSVDGLSCLGQDYWLTDCDSHFYPQTRAWAAAIRVGTGCDGTLLAPATQSR